MGLDNNIIYIIKMKDNATVLDDFRDYLVASQNPGRADAYYNLSNKTTPSDWDMFGRMDPDTTYRCALLDYQGDSITCLYWTKCKKYVSSEFSSMHCRLLYQTTDRAMIQNFVYSLLLDLEKDFAPDSYINCEISTPLIQQMRKFEQPPFYYAPLPTVYPPKPEEAGLSPLAQKNEYCRRKYNLRQPGERGEFQRDYDRILYSKSYRRMVDKAQIFSSVKGDHYRTRMTHTLIVCQIAHSICRALGLNCVLAEAISAGHDLGHTPFGHQGERTLNAILTGEPGFEVDHLPVRKDDTEPAVYPYGGFKHNYQSVRVASSLESQYLEIDGLDLSEQTLNGMWMHTGKITGMSIEDFSGRFLTDEGDYPFTLEGQAVAVADEIAQRSHDIDDAFSSRLITLSDFTDHLGLNKSSQLKEEIDHVSTTLKDLKGKNRLLTDENEIISAQISSIIVNHFIQDVCAEAKIRMAAYDVNKFISDGHKVKENLVWFSEQGEQLCKYLENLINKKVINSHEVTQFDENGSNVVLALFRAYYKTPMLLHDGTLKRIWNEYRQRGFDVVDFKEGKPKLVKEEWKNITTADISSDPANRTNCGKLLLEKRIILVRGICDFISGMTDSYACNEYHRLIS